MRSGFSGKVRPIMPRHSMYVYNTVSGSWDKVDAQQTVNGDGMTLTGDIPLQDHLDGTAVKVMIQNGEGVYSHAVCAGSGRRFSGQ